MINKQQPKKQIWWSSPVRCNSSLNVICSGPKRFEYNPDDKKWYEAAVIDDVKNCRQVQDDINGLLTKEMKSLVGVNLKFSHLCYNTRCHSYLRNCFVHSNGKRRIDRTDAEAYEKATWHPAIPLLPPCFYTSRLIIPDTKRIQCL